MGKKKNDMEQKFCQSCGMPLVEGNIGTNSDGSRSEDYCGYCYQNGDFTLDVNMNQMIEFCLQFTDQVNKETGWNLTPEQAKTQMQKSFQRSHAGKRKMKGVWLKKRPTFFPYAKRLRWHRSIRTVFRAQSHWIKSIQSDIMKFG